MSIMSLLVSRAFQMNHLQSRRTGNIQHINVNYVQNNLAEKYCHSLSDEIKLNTHWYIDLHSEDQLFDALADSFLYWMQLAEHSSWALLLLWFLCEWNLSTLKDSTSLQRTFFIISYSCEENRECFNAVTHTLIWVDVVSLCVCVFVCYPFNVCQ